jgi:AraC family transcriptional regulator
MHDTIRRTPAAPFAQSLRAGDHLPSHRLFSSRDLDWKTVLVDAYVDPVWADEFTIAATPDLLLVAVTKGAYVVESKKAGTWQRATYRPGSVGSTAPGNACTLRWRAEIPQRMESLHVHLSAQLLTATAAALGESGRLALDLLPDCLLLGDPLVEAALLSLGRAAQQSAPGLYADSIAQMLATHLLYGARAGRFQPAGTLARPALNAVVDYMHLHLQDDIDLAVLAKLANLSKFHFLRLFAQATGATPHRYLVRLRLQRAATMLRDTRQTILQVAESCGYRSQGHFAGAFRRQYGLSPTEFRRQGGY